MKLEETPIKDLYVLNRKIVKDTRGSFSRLFASFQKLDSINLTLKPFIGNVFVKIKQLMIFFGFCMKYILFHQEMTLQLDLHQ